MPIENALASVAVRDLESSVKWYEELLGMPGITADV
jgi:catechol 2,3-dioxygenase-like lactoylglutathione lyase family enzyme